MFSINKHLHNKQLCNFAKLLETANPKYNIGEVFHDFLQLAVCSFSMGKLEKTYSDTINKYDKKDMHLFPKMLGELMIYFKGVHSWSDPFGEIYEVIASNYKRSNFGQFFTPEEICTVTSQMMLTEREEKEFYTMADPACGSGRMLLSFHSICEKPNNYTAVDLDRTCVLMTALNMLFHGLRGVVVHGDSLRLKAFGAYEINPFLNLELPSIRPLTVESAQRILEAPFKKEEEKKEPDKPKERPQLLLDF